MRQFGRSFFFNPFFLGGGVVIIIIIFFFFFGLFLKDNNFSRKMKAHGISREEHTKKKIKLLLLLPWHESIRCPSYSLLPTAEPQSGLLRLRWSKSVHPKDSHSLLPTAGQWGGAPLLLPLGGQHHSKENMTLKRIVNCVSPKALLSRILNCEFDFCILCLIQKRKPRLKKNTTKFFFPPAAVICLQ